MSQFTRRGFLKTAAAAGAAFPLVTISGTKSSGQVIGANEAVRVAVAGINGRGGSHISELLGIPGARITHLVDPDSRLFASRSKTVAGRAGGKEPTCVQDIRKVLEDRSVDAITIATPNHWHSLMTIWAVQAGKDVYVEKPLSHNVSEGRRCVEATRKHGRMVQHGTQQRSSNGRASEIAAVQSGKYGRLLVSKGYCCKPRWSIGQKPEGAPPEGVAFDLWLGPAAERPFHSNLVHYNWHWFWDFGNGDIGNQGVHEFDVARWAIKGATLPNRVWSLGGRYAYDDQGQTPNTQMSVMEFGDVLLVFEVRGLVGKHEGFGNRVMNEYYTTDGRIANGQFFPKNGGKPEPLQRFDVKVNPGGPFGSFLNAVRSRKVEDLNADVEIGHYSSALCHLANISYRLGEKSTLESARQRLGQNPETKESFQNLVENLKAVGVKVDGLPCQVGPALTFDPKTERFTGEGSDRANALLTRDYRKGFVVPAKV